MTRITKRLVDDATPSEKDSYLWDGELKGFGLKITPKGRKVYILQYRMNGRAGRTRRFTIGQHGPVTADAARAKAKKLLGLVAAGTDPAEARDAERLIDTLGTAIERFFAEHVHTRRKARTAKEYRSLADQHIMPRFASRRITEIAYKDIALLHKDLRETPYSANRTVALLSKFFNWCEKEGLRPLHSNPCQHIEKYKEQKRERFLNSDEFASLGIILEEELARGTLSPWMVAAIRLLMLTGARLNEILTLKWEYVDLENSMLRLPDSKTGQKVIYLNAAAVDVLQGGSCSRRQSLRHLWCK